MPVPAESPTPPFLSTGIDLRAARLRDVRERFDWHSLVGTFGPYVDSMAHALVPEDPAAAAAVTRAVFELLKQRATKLRKQRLLAWWLFRTTLIASRRQRRELGLRTKPVTPAQKLLAGLERLAPKLQNPVLLCSFLEVNSAAAAAALRIKVRKLEKRQRKALSRLNRRLRKTGTDLQSIVASMRTAGPAADLVESLEQVEPETLPLVRQTLWGWRWATARAALKRILRTAATVVAVIALLATTFFYLATHGYLMDFFITMNRRQTRKDFPEMFVPARPWPQTAEDRAVAQVSPPGNSAELFTMTNIWPVYLSFTAEQWVKIEPSDVPRVREMFKDGRIILRNPKATRSGLAGVLGYDFNWTEARLNFAGQEFQKVGVRYRGNGTYLNSLAGSKQSLKLDVNKFDKGNRLAGIHELNLLNTIVDYSFMHDALAEQLFRELGTAAPRTTYAYVTVEIRDGDKAKVEPRGLFTAVENIDSDFAEDRFGTKKAPIFKPVTYDLFKDLGNDWASYKDIYDLKTKATPEQEQRVIAFAKLVSHASDEEFARQLPNYLDMDEFAGFLAGHVLLSSYDGFLVNGQNFYIYLDPRSNKFGFISWDQDHSWGDFGHVGTIEERESARIWKPATYDFVFLDRVLKVEAFREIYRRKLETALQGPFSTERLYPAIDLLAARIRPAVAAESDFRLNRFDRAVSSEWEPGPRNGEAEGPRAPIHQLKRFIQNRVQSVREQLDGKSHGVELRGFR